MPVGLRPAQATAVGTGVLGAWHGKGWAAWEERAVLAQGDTGHGCIGHAPAVCCLTWLLSAWRTAQRGRSGLREALPGTPQGCSRLAAPLLYPDPCLGPVRGIARLSQSSSGCGWVKRTALQGQCKPSLSLASHSLALLINQWVFFV